MTKEEQKKAKEKSNLERFLWRQGNVVVTKKKKS